MEQVTVPPILDVRVAVLNEMLAGSFKRLYPDFQPDNENHPMQLSARRTPRFRMLPLKFDVSHTQPVDRQGGIINR